MLAVVLEEAETYTLHHYNTITKYITNCTILEMSLEVEPIPWAQLARILLEQGGLDLEGARLTRMEAEA